MSTRIARPVGLTALLFLALVALASGPAAATPARLQATATLTGQVRSSDNQPLAGIRLAAYTQPGSTTDRQPVATVQTDATGSYSVSVPAGPIWMSVLTQDVQGQSFWGYDREPVNVVAGARLDAQDFVIAIRVLPAAPPTPAPTPEPAPPVGMPASGQPGAVPVLLLLALLVLLGTGLALRRAAQQE